MLLYDSKSELRASSLLDHYWNVLKRSHWASLLGQNGNRLGRDTISCEDFEVKPTDVRWRHLKMTVHWCFTSRRIELERICQERNRKPGERSFKRLNYVRLYLLPEGLQKATELIVWTLLSKSFKSILNLLICYCCKLFLDVQVLVRNTDWYSSISIYFNFDD